MGNRQFGVSASTAQEDEHSQNAQKTTDKEAEGEKRIWASHMYTVRENHDSCNMKPRIHWRRFASFSGFPLILLWLKF